MRFPSLPRPGARLGRAAGRGVRSRGRGCAPRRPRTASGCRPPQQPSTASTSSARPSGQGGTYNEQLRLSAARRLTRPRATARCGSAPSRRRLEGGDGVPRGEARGLPGQDPRHQLVLEGCSATATTRPTAEPAMAAPPPVARGVEGLDAPRPTPGSWSNGDAFVDALYDCAVRGRAGTSTGLQAKSGRPPRDLGEREGDSPPRAGGGDGAGRFTLAVARRSLVPPWRTLRNTATPQARGRRGRRPGATAASGGPGVETMTVLCDAETIAATLRPPRHAQTTNLGTLTPTGIPSLTRRCPARRLHNGSGMPSWATSRFPRRQFVGPRRRPPRRAGRSSHLPGPTRPPGEAHAPAARRGSGFTKKSPDNKCR